jgi:hypothetical protein
MMQSERSQPRCSPQSEVTDQNLQSETPFRDLPIESVQEAQGTTSPSGWRQRTILSANDTGCRLSFVDAKSLVLPSFSDKKYCTIRVNQHPGFNGRMATISDAGVSLQAENPFGTSQFCFSMFGYVLC